MPGRKFSSTTQYRYGFNGKEEDDEVKGDGNQQDYGMRIYDPRLGRFLSVDPLTKEYPWYTPYQFAGNKPIWCIDLDGGEEKIVTIYKGADGKTHQQIFKASDHTHTEWAAIQKSFAGGFVKQKTSSYEWTGGFANYNSLSHGSDRNNIEWSGPSHGTLTVNATGNVTTVNYDDTKVKGSTGVKTATFAQSVKMGAKGFKDFFIKADPLVEGSAASVETTREVAMQVGMLFGAEAFVAFRFVRGAEVVEETIQYTKSSLKLGQQMHKLYKAGLEDGINTFKEYRLPSGKRIDFLDIKNGIIYELKPFNPRSMKEGFNQLQQYMQELQSLPQFKGINWKTVLDVY